MLVRWSSPTAKVVPKKEFAIGTKVPASAGLTVVVMAVKGEVVSSVSGAV
jgi:hypothetical protein